MKTHYGNTKMNSRQYSKALVSYRDKNGEEQTTVLGCTDGCFMGTKPTALLFELIEKNIQDDLGAILDIKARV